MDNVKTFWESLSSYIILENSLQNIAIAGAILVLAFIFRRFISVQFNKFIYRFLKSLSSEIPVKEFVNLHRKPVEFLIFLVMIYAAFSFIEYPIAWHLSSEKKFGLKMFINRGYQLLLFFAIIWTLFRTVDFFTLVLKKRAAENESKLQEQLVPFMRQLLKIVIGIVFFFVMLAVIFKVNVGAVITGLGIGGVAVALAGKETLENLLASFTIFVDKPFVAGDLVKVQGIVGNVESVGFRTTRIRTVDKSLVTIPNKLLIDQPLENLTNRQLHRNRIVLGLPYGTPIEIVNTVIERLKNAIENHAETSPDYLVFLDNFGTYALEITVIYNVYAVDFGDFFRVKEDLNFKFHDIIENSGADFEYPTSIVYYRNGDSRQSIPEFIKNEKNEK